MTFFLTAIFVFLVFWRPQEWLVPGLYGWPLLWGVMGLALMTLTIEVNERKIRFPRRLPQTWILGGLWFAAMMSHVADFYLAGLMWTIVPTFNICFFTLLLFCVLDRPSRLRRMALIFVVMACVMSIHALMQQRLHYGFAGSRPLFIREGYRGQPAHTRSLFFGIFGDPNDLAQILVTALPLTFAMFRRKTVVGTLVSCGLATLILFGIFSTHSRGGYLALAFTGSVMMALVLPARWLPRLLLFLALSALLLTPMAAGYLDQSAVDRLDFWGQANWAFKSRPVFGVGYGMFPDYIRGGRAAHNAFVLCYTELGVFGYFFWFSLILLGYVGAWRARVAMGEPKTLEQAWLQRYAGLGIAAMSGFLVSSYFLTRAFVYPLFFLMAMLGVLPRLAEAMLPEDRPALIEPRRDVWTYGTLGALGSIAYIYWSIILLNRIAHAY